MLTSAQKLQFPQFCQGSRNANINDIPEHMHEGLLNYIEFGIRPGNFLYHALINDWYHAAQYADEENKHSILDYIRFFYLYAPNSCHGDEETVNSWIDRGGLTGREEPEE